MEEGEAKTHGGLGGRDIRDYFWCQGGGLGTGGSAGIGGRDQDRDPRGQTD